MLQMKSNTRKRYIHRYYIRRAVNLVYGNTRISYNGAIGIVPRKLDKYELQRYSALTFMMLVLM